MELKNYQKRVMKNLSSYLDFLNQYDMKKAWSEYWAAQDVAVGSGGVPQYRDEIKGVPHICFKVPTGGGKTFMACSSLKPIFDKMPLDKPKVVVWLAPSDAIIEQTINTLSNVDHPYRQRIDRDFSGKVGVYTKEQLLNGQNFSPDTVKEMLTICVLSYASLRVDSKKKDVRKVYQENGNLKLFADYFKDDDVLLADTDETALIQALRHLEPVTVVDESHNASSNLSVEMLNNLNPSFILDLTATPRKNSNILSYVDARELKKENMVKLPVIVYNRRSQEDVFADAISIRQKLEFQAFVEGKNGGPYIRPIVLFQAQPNINSDSTTYDKIKQTLVDAGIPKEQIAIKTADKDELKQVNLLSSDCPIRFIITVNALKEGWDCPFAYVLATVANRSSSVDVEQILGRVLRLPYARKNSSNLLNISYVITSSNDFGQTLNKVVAGLNHAGFSRKDCRAKNYEEPSQAEPEVTPITESLPAVSEDDLPEVSIETIKDRINQTHPHPFTKSEPTEMDEMLSTALQQSDEYEEQISQPEDTAFALAPPEVRDKMNVFGMNDCFSEEALTLRIPQFMLKTAPNFFFDTELLTLKLEHLEEGFTLKDKDVQIDFSTVDAEMARVDVDDSTDSVPKAWKLQGTDSAYFKEWFNSQPSEKRLKHCKDMICGRISKMNCINDKELQEYVNRVVDTLSKEQLDDMEQSVYPYSTKIEEKVKALLAAHRENVFELWQEQGKIVCEPNYQFCSVISPTKFTSTYPKSLYTSEEDMNEFERKTVWALSSLDNIKWWHRNISRLGFQINGAIHAYPDIIAMTTNGKIIVVETKGDHLDNDESKAKAKLGHLWDSLSGSQYRYFMVFESKSPDYPGAYSYDRFMEIVKGL